MRVGHNDPEQLTWVRITDTAAYSDKSIVAAKAGFIAKIFHVCYSSLAANNLFFEQATTKIGPEIDVPATTARELTCEIAAPVGVAITATSTATTTLTLYVGYKYFDAVLDGRGNMLS